MYFVGLALVKFVLFKRSYSGLAPADWRYSWPMCTQATQQMSAQEAIEAPGDSVQSVRSGERR